MVIWITGLSGTGKTTVANKLAAVIPHSIRIDGDKIRAIFENKDYSSKGRLKNAMSILGLCRYFDSQGFTVICSTISLFKEVHEIITNLSGFYVILLEAKIETLQSRSKIYKLDQVVGKDILYDMPTQALKISTDDFNVNLGEILKYVGLQQSGEIL